MVVIGLTGGIGSGKTTVGEMMKGLGAAYLNADLLGHEMLIPPSPLLNEVVHAFGRDYLLPSGEIDRKKLGERVFKDKQALAQLNKIMHPRMLDMVKSTIEEWRRQGYKAGVVEAAALIEAHWDLVMDEVWVTVAPREVIIGRLQVNKGMAREEIVARMNSQLSAEERSKKARVIIDTGCSMEDLKKKIARLWEEVLSRSNEEENIFNQ